jgi:DNA-directed RNA polymerase specialized sigma24 family protein
MTEFLDQVSNGKFTRAMEAMEATERLKSQLQMKDTEAELLKSQSEQFKSQLQMKDTENSELARKLVLLLRRLNKSPEEISAEVNIDLSEVNKILAGNGGCA